MSSLSNNPLTKHFRQPILYIKLPSDGHWYPEGTVDIPVTGEIPVYAMTARDEITMRTPDALMNGTSTVNVIKSCCPSIRDPWKMPIVDLDTVLMSIRIATYGKEMEFTAVCPHCTTKNEKAIDISVMMSKINPGDWSKPVRINGMEITIKPQTYEDYNKNNISNFDEQRLIQIVQNQDLSDDEKTQQFDDIFQKLIETGIDTVSKNIASIRTEDGIVVDNYAFIRDFLDNCDKSVWDAIKKYLDVIRESNDYNKVTLECSNEECTKEFSTPFVFEQTNFFG
jgi:hypothetical protein